MSDRSDTETDLPPAVPWGAVAAILVIMWIAAPFVKAFHRLETRLTA